jgi:hypothetical protein
MISDYPFKFVCRQRCGFLCGFAAGLRNQNYWKQDCWFLRIVIIGRSISFKPFLNIPIFIFLLTDMLNTKIKGGHTARLFTLVCMFLSIAGCKKPYNPPAISSPGSYLVVEGIINSGSDSTFIKLSRTVNLNSKTTVNPELHAIVTVQGDQNMSYPLTETGKGNYVCAGLNLDNTHKYRLSVKTASNKQYLSDYMPVLNSPPIDSVSFNTKGALNTPGLNIFVSTHDPANKVLYYRWEYQETWVFHANFPSNYKSNGDTVLGRDLINDNITNCWASDTSSDIILGSSAKIAHGIIADNPITSVVSTSEKVGDEYSILVKQYALTADAYNFYVNLKKNTQDLGSIFDAEPSEIPGNIHCITDPSEPVIGYVSVGSTSSQRIFIAQSQLPNWTTIPFYPDCILALSPKEPCCYYVYVASPPTGYNTFENQVNEYINYKISGDPDPLIPIDAIGKPGSPPIGYTAAVRSCVDCTLRGTNKRPSFWK